MAPPRQGTTCGWRGTWEAWRSCRARDPRLGTRRSPETSELPGEALSAPLVKCFQGAQGQGGRQGQRWGPPRPGASQEGAVWQAWPGTSTCFFWETDAFACGGESQPGSRPRAVSPRAQHAVPKAAQWGTAGQTAPWGATRPGSNGPSCPKADSWPGEAQEAAKTRIPDWGGRTSQIGTPPT